MKGESIEVAGVGAAEVSEVGVEEEAVEADIFDIVEETPGENAVERSHSSRSVGQYQRRGDKYFS